MKKILYVFLAALVLAPSCKKDVFATWRDPSKYVIKPDNSYFTVMQYNIWGASNGWTSARFDEVAAVINAQKPDFVSLNEVDSLTSRNKFFMCRELAERTGMFYAFAKAIEPHYYSWIGDGAYGDAILSKHPIKQVRRFKMYPDEAQGTTEKEDRSVVAVQVELNGRLIWIVSTHLDHRSGEQSRISQAGQLKDIIATLDGSLVLCGDLNTSPDSQTMEIIGTYMTPQYPSATKEYYTYPSKYNGQSSPTRLLDYILLKKAEAGLRCMSYRIVNSTASDHCAVVATFKFIEESTSSVRESVSVRAGISSSKVSVDEQGKTAWEEGDAIALFVDGRPFKLTLSEGAGSAEAVFTGELDVRGKSFNGVAVYPYDENLLLDGNSVTLNLSSDVPEGHTIPAPMVASETEGVYTFRNVAALLRIRYENLPSMAQSVRLTASHTISGSFTLADYATSSIEMPATTDGNVVTVPLPVIRPDHSAYVDIPVPAGTLSSLKAELLDVNGKVLDTHTTASKTFAAGTLKPLAPVSIPGDRMNLEWVWDKGNLPVFRSNFPAIDDEGNVYVVSNEGALNKIDKEGRLVWRTILSGMGGKVETSPSVEPDGSAIYMAGGQDGSGNLYAIASDGSIKWVFNQYPWGSTRNFWQTTIAVGTDNLYVPVGTLCTLLTVDKASGNRVSFGAGSTSGGSNTNMSGAGAGSALGLGGTVSYMTTNGAYTFSQDQLDHPTLENGTWGKFAVWGYRDHYYNWGVMQRDKQGVVAARKGSENVIISCAQESNHRFNVCCYPASYGTDNSLQRHNVETLDYTWRYQFGGAPWQAADQDQGGMIVGHDNSVVIVPLKYKAGNVEQGDGGLFTAKIADGTGSWRLSTGNSNVSGAAAVDNNGHVHVATDAYYYIVKPDVAAGTCTVLAQVSLKNLLRSKGDVPDLTATGVWSSVKIAKGGRIYLNVNVGAKRGVTACFTYPGVTGPSASSSWPQKGADQYNSSNQQL